jgi:hypothetical protein
MTGYRFFRTLHLLVGMAMWLLVVLCFLASTIYKEVSRESAYHRRWGADWPLEYEKDFGSLSEARTKSAACAFGLVAIPCLSVWLVGTLGPARHYRPKHRRPQRYISSLERVARYRRNALVGIYFGLPGILLAIFLVVFRVGIFSTHQSEVILGFFVFILGDFAVLAGCYYWLKAKGQSEALVVVGVMPVGVAFIPFVRIILYRLFLANPSLLVVPMVMLPLILVVVVLTLPNRLGTSNRRASLATLKNLKADKPENSLDR